MLPAAINVQVCGTDHDAWFDCRYEPLTDQRRFSELLVKRANKTRQVDTTDRAGVAGTMLPEGWERRCFPAAGRRGEPVYSVGRRA